MFYQIGALSAFARSYGTVLQPVTPHGRLGNLVVTKVEYAKQWQKRWLALTPLLRS
jgi:UPF0271 protein